MDNEFRPVRKEDKAPFNLGAFLKLIRTSNPRYIFLILGIILGLISTGLQLLVPRLAASLVDSFQKQINTNQLILVIVLFIGSALISVVSGAVLGVFGESVVANIRKNVWQKMTTLHVSYFDETKAGEMSSRISNDSTAVKNLLAQTVPSTMSSLLMVVGSVIIMFTLNWKMTLLMIVAVPVAMLLLTPVIRFSSRIGMQRQDALAKFTGTTSETLSEIKLVKSSNAEDQATAKGNTEIGSLYKVGIRESIVNAIMGPFILMIMMVLIFGSLIYGVSMVANGEMTIGVLISFSIYLFNLMGAVPTIGQLFSQAASAAGSTARINEILAEDSEDLQKGEELDFDGKILSANKVNFSYEKGQRILSNVSFEAKPNTVVAFAGPSGGGKSTIFGLIERFYQPTSGKITIGKTDAKKISLHNWREQIGLVAQDSAILAGTIRENLVYGLKGEYSDGQLWEVLRLAYADQFVKKMPDQLDTQVGERGTKVSGGQRQRLAIARAFLRNPKILMLDEATASLDSQSEAMVQKALDTLMKDRTTLVIAHRLSTIVDADQIYFVEGGKITGNGTHKQLLKKHALYKSYVKEQFKE